MSITTREIDAPGEAVWSLLADGWTYPLWVVGAARVRDVDAGWPAPGSRIHHSVGAWPLLIDDTTDVLDLVPGRRLSLRARGWPAGEAEVVISLEAAAGSTRIVLQEDVVAGPGRVLPAGLRGPLLHARNVETLRRLAYLAERGGSPGTGPGGPAGSVGTTSEGGAR